MRRSALLLPWCGGAPALVGVLALAAGCGGDDTPAPVAATGEDVLYVAHNGSLVSYDIATGQELPGAVQDVAGPVDLQALSDATLMVNLTGRDEVLCVDGESMLEVARIPSSAAGGKRPVHSYLSPERGGATLWLTLNDGTEGELATNSARFIDATVGSATFMQPLGEVALGAGHHKASFSATQERVVISNIADCDNVLTVYDYADPADIRPLATLTAAAAGWDGSSYARTCDPTYEAGVPPAPHGCATSKVSGKAYCNLTSSGELVEIDIDADTPTFRVIPTAGAGAGYTKASADGRYIYSLQEEPREGSTVRPGAACQIGQMVVLDAEAGAVVDEVPLLYKGAGCTESLAGTDEETANPGHLRVSADGGTMYIVPAGGFGDDAARVRQVLVLDLADPAHPAQRPSIAVGASTGHHGDALSGGGRWLFIANNVDGSVTQIDAATREIVRTFETEARPETVATFGRTAGPSEQSGPIH